MRHDRWLTRSVYPIYRRVMEPVRRSRPLARRLFGIECPGGSPYFLWDLVTLGLRRVVCTPAQALDCFERTEMDALFLGQLVVTRPGAEGAASPGGRHSGATPPPRFP